MPDLNWTLVVPIIGTLCAVAFGSWLNSSREHMKWLRDRKLDAYAGVLASLEIWNFGEDEHFPIVPTMQRFRAASERTKLLAPPMLVDALTEVSDVFTDLWVDEMSGSAIDVRKVSLLADLTQTLAEHFREDLLSEPRKPAWASGR